MEPTKKERIRCASSPRGCAPLALVSSIFCTWRTTCGQRGSKSDQYGQPGSAISLSSHSLPVLQLFNLRSVVTCCRGKHALPDSGGAEGSARDGTSHDARDAPNPADRPPTLATLLLEALSSASA